MNTDSTQHEQFPQHIKAPNMEVFMGKNISNGLRVAQIHSFRENDARVYDVLLSFGDKCECLAPPHVRRELKRKIEALAALYV